MEDEVILLYKKKEKSSMESTIRTFNKTDILKFLSKVETFVTFTELCE